MTEVVEQWKTVAALFAEQLAAVGDDQWETATPCSDWTVRQLVEHAVDVQRNVPKALGAEGHDASIDGDPSKGWATIVEATAQALAEPGALDRTIPSPMGERPVAQAIGIPTMDLMVHTWDLATALGRTVALPADLCEHAYAQLQPMDQMIRAGGMFGPKVDVSDDAPVQDRFIAFTGRTP